MSARRLKTSFEAQGSVGLRNREKLEKRRMPGYVLNDEADRFAGKDNVFKMVPE